MALIILVVFAGLGGYFLARGLQERKTTSSNNRNQTAVSRSSSKKTQSAFVVWATGPAGAYFPEDFKVWLVSMDPAESREFEDALDVYTGTLGYRLKEVENGSLTNQLALMKNFVEVVVIYSNTFRKAREALRDQEKENEDSDLGSKAEKQDEIAPAEKNPSRRKQAEIPVAVPAPAV